MEAKRKLQLPSPAAVAAAPPGAPGARGKMMSPVRVPAPVPLSSGAGSGGYSGVGPSLAASPMPSAIMSPQSAGTSSGMNTNEGVGAGAEGVDASVGASASPFTSAPFVLRSAAWRGAAGAGAGTGAGDRVAGTPHRTSQNSPAHTPVRFESGLEELRQAVRAPPVGWTQAEETLQPGTRAGTQPRPRMLLSVPMNSPPPLSPALLQQQLQQPFRSPQQSLIPPNGTTNAGPGSFKADIGSGSGSGSGSTAGVELQQHRQHRQHQHQQGSINQYSTQLRQPMPLSPPKPPQQRSVRV